MKILIAEDNSINQRIFLAFLNTKFDIKIANNGQEAYEAFKIDDYSCILMDLHMPIMDGLETSRSIRKYEKENNLLETPILAVTASHPAEDKEKCFEAGMNDFIQKPITEKGIIGAINRWTENIPKK